MGSLGFRGFGTLVLTRSRGPRSFFDVRFFDVRRDFTLAHCPEVIRDLVVDRDGWELTQDSFGFLVKFGLVHERDLDLVPRRCLDSIGPHRKPSRTLYTIR